MENKYYTRSKISEAKFRHLVRCFALDLTATETAVMTGISLRSVNAIYLRIRGRMAEACERQSPFSGQVEIDESYFGPHRVRGKRGRGAGGKTIVFGILKRGGQVFTQVVPNCSKAALLGVIRGHVKRKTTIHSDGWKAYDGLVDMGYQKHHRVNHGANEFARGKSHINGIESFWSYAKRRLARFNGISKATFHLHLKECEFRFNCRHEDLYQTLLNLLRSHPL
ncbi:IS1595 family transposase [Geothrix fuzhouensis]|uniref:IS1595 family transposase n=1 Tax=Geothrix fuzhouensis TaxID=2966451 RepID=UPI00214844C1|nr:IS1595 family transposase [Geothrix fuzhouensis]